LQPGQQKFSDTKENFGATGCTSPHRLNDGSLLVVATQSAPKTIANYANRWGIETLFGISKLASFCLESTI